MKSQTNGYLKNSVSDYRQETLQQTIPAAVAGNQRFLRKFSVGSKSGQIILPKLYEPCPHCGGFHPEASGDIPDNMENEVIKIAGEIFNSGSKVTFSPGLLSRTVAQIQEKLIEGYGRDFPQIIYNTPDYEELRNLTENVYSFSAG